MARSEVDTGARLLADLQERARELECLYEVEEILRREELGLEEAFTLAAGAIPHGLQHADVAHARIVHEGRRYPANGPEPTTWRLDADLAQQDRAVGQLTVWYDQARPTADHGPFQAQEVRLVESLAQRLGHHALVQRVRTLRSEWQAATAAGEPQAGEWRGPIRLLREFDEALYLRIARRMLNHLFSIGAPGAADLMTEVEAGSETAPIEQNVPGRRQQQDVRPLLSDRPWELAAAHYGDAQTLALVRSWMLQDKASFFTKVVDNPRSSLNEIVDVLRRFGQTMSSGRDLAPATRESLRVSLTRRFMTEQPEFVRIAKEHVRVSDFVALIDRVILLPDSYGRLGGKASGVMLARAVLERSRPEDPPVGTVKVPRTWYIPSNGLLDFVVHNGLEDLIDQKWKDVDQVRQEYPNVVQLFKNATFPAEVVHGVSALLDETEDTPLVVRSSSLLEDRLGTAFSGKYKSLFVAGHGTKAERTEALLDAIAEVYASTFSPDPIEYRRERNLLEFYEEMGIMIQEVVGKRVGRYYMPAFAGVMLSRNEFRWTPRIRREDGLLRLVPGLGTRAVDRVADDRAMLIAPGQPSLRVHVDVNEAVRNAPARMDVIDLELGTLVTVPIEDVIREAGADYPGLEWVFSLHVHGMLRKPLRLLFDPEADEVVATFQGLIEDTPFLKHVSNMLSTLEDHLGHPVDIEFAHDGDDFYLLQCRPQSFSDYDAPAQVPRDAATEDVLFTARRFVSNGWLPDLTHVVYVDPDAYAALPTAQDRQDVARAVGALNKALPRRLFALLGPGRWGSRDIQLGVPVTYADINNVALLIEIARQRGHYTPDLSFGTHFFQDLVEAQIRYLPLYPDDAGILFNEDYLRGWPNLLPQLVPAYAHLEHVVRAIDVPAATGGRRLRVLMNAELDEAMGLLVEHARVSTTAVAPRPSTAGGAHTDAARYSLWRERMAERIALDLDPERFGVRAVYVVGSTSTSTAGPDSDLDLIVHFAGDDAQRRDLAHWLEGWSRALAEVNYLRTGHRREGLLDVRLVGDDEVASRKGPASKIGAPTDPARRLQLGGRRPEEVGRRPRARE